jgi:DHA1 family bicyclomycin/chloramphenicol resistance-like MFS transporter
MKIELIYFGLYQGTLAGAFSILCILSPKLLAWYGQKNCLYYSILLYTFSVLALLLVTLSGIQDPKIITGVMIIYSISAALPINIFYPISLELIKNSKSRTAALINGIKLLGTALALEAISYFYVGKFLPIGIALLIILTLGLFLVWKIFYQSWRVC